MDSWKSKMISYRKEDITEELFLIDESDVDYITKTGNVYLYSVDDNLYYKRKTHINKNNGYVYVTIKSKELHKNNTRRLHILLARTFLDNHNNYKIVGHKNNNKSDNSLDNLYWTTNQENTQKAFDDKLNIPKSGIEASSSFPIATIENGEVIAVYGSMRECSRCIDNLTFSYLSKIIKSNGDYKTRSKKYKYKKITIEEYNSYPEYMKNVKLVENFISKKQTIFKATNIYTKEITVSDNQKQFAKSYNLEQSMVSQAILKNKIYGDFKFELLGKKNYSETSAYKNFIATIDGISIKNMITEEIKTYQTIKDLKTDLNIKGHDIKQYIYRDNILMDQWKVIS